MRLSQTLNKDWNACSRKTTSTVTSTWKILSGGDIDIHGDELPVEPTTAEVPTLTAAGQQLHAHYSEQLQGADTRAGESQTHKSNTKNYYDEEYRNIATSYPSLQYDENETQAGGILRAAEPFDFIAPPKPKI